MNIVHCPETENATEHLVSPDKLTKATNPMLRKSSPKYPPTDGLNSGTRSENMASLQTPNKEIVAVVFLTEIYLFIYSQNPTGHE